MGDRCWLLAGDGTVIRVGVCSPAVSWLLEADRCPDAKRR